MSARALHRLFLIACSALLLVGCGLRFAYSQLDWLLPWYLRDYVTLDAGQRGEFDRRLAGLLDWHCRSHLPEYVALLRAANATGPMVLVSSTTFEKSAEGVFDRVLTKPIKPSRLYETIRGLFDDGKIEQYASTAPSFDAEMSGRMPLRILVAEDNTVNQIVLQAMLARFGYSCDFAANGREAIEALRRQHYDLIFMDVRMPEVDGLSATREIRRMESASLTYIMGLTANATVDDRRDCEAAGMDGYLTKPITAEKLTVTLKTAHDFKTRNAVAAP